MERGQGGEGWENIRCSNNEGLNVTLASDYGFFKIQWRPQVLYVFGIVTENADRISPWQCPNPWSWTMSMSIYWFNPKCCMFLELSQEMLMISDIGYTHICCYGHGNVHFWVFWVLLKLFLEAKWHLGPRAVLKEVAYRSTWTWLMMSGRLKVKKICNAFLAKLGCFKAF